MNAEVLRIPPHSAVSEQAVIGCCLISVDCLSHAIEKIKASDFYDRRHQDVFETMVQMWNEKKAVDLATFSEKLRMLDKLDLIGGIEYLMECMEIVVTVDHIGDYVETVKEMSLLRSVISACMSSIAQCYSGEQDGKDILDSVENIIFNTSQNNFTQDMGLIGSFTNQVTEYLKDTSVEASGLSTGFLMVDALTSGMNPGDLIILGARPGVGKTSCAMNIIEHLAIDNKVPIIFYSLEMTPLQLCLRLLSSRTGISLYALRQRRVSPYMQTTVIEKLEEIASANIVLDDGCKGLTILGIKASARRWVSKFRAQGHKNCLIVIDYIQLLSPSKKFENRNLEVSDITRNLKQMALEMKVPILALSQLNRKSTSSTVSDPRPQLTDLRDSGSLEQDADMVWFLHRPGMYKKIDKTGPESIKRDSEERAKTEFIIEKQRNGVQQVIVDMVFDGKQTKFEETPMDSQPQKIWLEEQDQDFKLKAAGQ